MKRRRAREEEKEGVAASISDILQMGLPQMMLPAWAQATAAEELRAGYASLDRTEGDGNNGGAGIDPVIVGRPRLRSTAAQVGGGGARGPERASAYVEGLRRSDRMSEEQTAKRKQMAEQFDTVAPLPSVAELLQQWAEREEGACGFSD